MNQGALRTNINLCNVLKIMENLDFFTLVTYLQPSISTILEKGSLLFRLVVFPVSDAIFTYLKEHTKRFYLYFYKYYSNSDIQLMRLVMTRPKGSNT